MVKRDHLVSRDLVCKSTVEGSLGFRKISLRNQALLGKWFWRFSNESHSLWVRILGLPISLWVPSILRRVGEECGGFLGIDPLTERKEDLEWPRIQVKINGRALPSSLEIGVEGEIYVVSLWWEIPPAIRKKQGDGRDEFGRQRGEVRGDGDPRAGWRVGEKPGAGTKEQRRSEEVTGEQVGGEGGDVFEN